MASRSPSRSEGEVLSSDSEAKANTSRSSRNDTKVDRHTRPSLAPRSPAANPHRPRSRSPYRAPRGEKRPREDEYARDKPRHDPRTFHVRYEDDRPSRRRYGSHDYRDSKRSKIYSGSRSRSPYRPRQENGTRGDNPVKEKGNERSRTDRSESVDAVTVTQDAQEYETAGLVRVQTKLKDSHAKPRNRTVSTEDTDTIDQPSLDEAALIEERRKRREAIKNKYRGQATPLLVQALRLGAVSSQNTPGSYSAPSSPGRPGPNISSTIDKEILTRNASPAADSSVSSQPSGPRSPADFASPKAEEFANKNMGSPAPDEEPSAADYDPTVDMQEERARHDKRLFKEDDAALPEAECHLPHESTPLTDSSAKPKAEFDIFADDDDDDMFAEVPMKPSHEAKAPQALDANMMDNWDNSEGYYITILGELIDDRYQVTQNLGRGMFSSVVRAEDSKSGQTVAIKIIRNNESMRRAGMKEIDILNDIAANDPEDRKHVIRLLRSFDHKGHLCMVFENLSLNLREVLKKFGRDIGINLKAIRAYAQQLFVGLSMLKKCQYLHADLKPDNILVNEARNVLKICDLGSASPITENATAPYLVSRFYRAPEVILGIVYDYGIDMWSIGCTLFELYTGKILFTGRNNNNMLKSIMDCRGKFPHKLLRRGALTCDYFDDLLNFRMQEVDQVTGRIMTKLVDVKAKPVRDLRSRLIPKGKRLDEQERKEVELFLDLLDKCLDLRPDKRISPIEALKHPFITRAKA